MKRRVERGQTRVESGERRTQVERGQTRVESGERRTRVERDRTRVERGQTRVERGRTRVRRWAWKKRPCRPSGKRANASGKTEEVEREWGGGSGKSDPVGHGRNLEVNIRLLESRLRARDTDFNTALATIKLSVFTMMSPHNGNTRK